MYFNKSIYLVSWKERKRHILNVRPDKTDIF